MFEKLEPRRIFRRQRDEATRHGRKVHNEEFRYMYSSQSIDTVVKSERTW